MADTSPNTPSTISLDDSASTNPVTQDWFHHSSGQRINTDTFIFRSIQARHPSEHVTVVSEGSCDLLSFAAAGYAVALPIDDRNPSVPTSYKWRQYVPPRRRLDGGDGVLGDRLFYGEFKYAYEDHEFYVYLVDGRDGSSILTRRNYYIVGAEDLANKLIMTVGKWHVQLHDEVWVFNQGLWQKDPELYKSIQKSSWDNVILDAEKKSTIIADVDRFFNSRQTYKDLAVGWKRGLIFYGPPGNGKTISIKVMSHSLYERADPIPTLYVRSLASYGGPEFALSQIFSKARQTAPCLLVFEDLDSLVTDAVRSFFLNEVDGLTNNDGILMIGSTNHLERLDPGISKRPSRFDRKYPFANPTEDERVQYADFWKKKLKSNKDIEFPHKLSVAIAKITHGFSFAYIQEAFVASLLEIAAHNGDTLRVLQATREPQLDAEALAREYKVWGLRIIALLIAGVLPQYHSLLVCLVCAALALFVHLTILAPKATRQSSTTQGSFNTFGLSWQPRDDDLDHNILWLAFKKQVKLLREVLDDGGVSGF